MRKDFIYSPTIWCSNTPNFTIGKSANAAFYIKFISNLLTKNNYYETF